ncbi:NFACT RNA binding domain-containing protein [Petroclostridium sp. X23]|uniref:Rqc2 family fibronectin-binding protein n=1 Tax=Petroclostridium sp. X23 TaxID=3045146 RepID=UPI0024AE0168|nr:NFACT RNA binding domain-containing protein [Petroclostridium sp. X23]WHH59908.1 NFACT RNA binding domain-containing protein [Petroclostridium sp. X23]
MPLDGIVVNCLVHEFNDRLLNGRIEKVYQPEKDELMILIRNKGKNERLLLSASSNHPRVHFTATNKPNPAAPPMFCMLLRKHLTGGKIINIVQPDFERIIHFYIEVYNELGDLTVKNLIIEIMGRHSNIILVDSNGKIIDSIKHVGIDVSSVRQVMPGLTYSPAPSQDKKNPLECKTDDIRQVLEQQSQGLKVDKCLLNNFMGISPLIARELCFRSLKSSDFYIGELEQPQLKLISDDTAGLFDQVKRTEFFPVLIFDEKNEKVIDFSALNITQYTNYTIRNEESINQVLDFFYSARDHQERLKQKLSDLVRIVNTNLDRCKKKLSIQQQKLGEVSNREQLKIFGDLITANIYRIHQGLDHIEVENFYEDDCPAVTIPLDPDLVPSKNAQKYFNEYTRGKNAAAAVTEQMRLNIDEINYLESILDIMMRINSEQELHEIREELIEQGYLNRKNKSKKKDSAVRSKPMHFVSSDGLDIYVGKNNKQNDYLTLRFAQNEDIWLHTKDIPGSHTIIKMNGWENLPDNTLMEAASLAAFYSKGRMSSNVAVDYTAVKNVKKPAGAKPGMVIYVNNRTVYVTPKEELTEKLQKKIVEN